MKMRTIEQVADWIKVKDPDTALTKHAVRQLVTSGQLPSVRVGQKYLISLETLEDYLRGSVPLEMPEETSGIRRIEI